MYVYTIYNYNNLQRTLIVETTLQRTRPLTTEVNPIYGGNLLSEIADHLVQFISMGNDTTHKTQSNYYKRDYSKWNDQNFLDDLAIQSWGNELQDINKIYDDFIWRFKGCVNRHSPQKKVNKKEQKLINKPWIAPSYPKKDFYCSDIFVMKKNKLEDEHLRKTYNRFRNSVNKDIKNSKKNCYSPYFEACKSNMTKTWKGINEIISIRPNSPLKLINQINHNNILIDDPKLISNTFNDFFINVGTNTDKSIPFAFASPKSYLKHRINSNFTILHTSIAEVMTLILQLDDSKAPGPTDIPINILKIAAPVIVPHVVKIINKSFEQGIYPNSLKIAKVIPIFKAGSKLEVTNYRPISLSTLSKIIEKLMHIRLFSFLEANKVIYNSQFGFQKGKSTTHSLIEITEKIRDCMENKNYGRGIFIDLSKAFDTVDHNIQKLEHYGLRDISLNWFISYLKDRSQYVFCNNISSKTKNINCGVPQGSVLGPLLFILYINDLPNISNELSFHLFADDTNIFFKANNLDTLQTTVNREISKLVNCLNSNRLALNVSKINFVIFLQKINL